MEMITLHCVDPWFSFILQGLKAVEGRKGTAKNRQIKCGDRICFTNGQDSFIALVTEVREYRTLEEYLDDVTLQGALPGTGTMAEAVTIYHQWSTEEEIRLYGFLGIFVKPVA